MKFNIQIKILVIISSLLFACSNNDKLKVSIDNAGINSAELKKVIEHFKKNPADSLKLKAAYFLIENMNQHYSYDTLNLFRYRDVVKEIQSLRSAGKTSEEIRVRANKMMDSLVSLYPLNRIYSITNLDAHTISSSFLITNINLAFKAYETNPFKNEIGFKNFLNYVLPYRLTDGQAIEDWRTYFMNKFVLNDHYNNIRELSDSILINYKNVQIEWKVAATYPYLKLQDYLTSLSAHCPQKCWFNSLLLRSYGVPTTMDYTPVSREHSSGHEWNSIVMNDRFYPFDAFWDESTRNLKDIYQGKIDHPKLGPMSFPKILRKTFEVNNNELLQKHKGSLDKIPVLFRNPFFKDVTSEYFSTFNIEFKNLKKLKGEEYIYSCVLGINDSWVPVEYAKINKGKALFKNLGPENIYLPAYYTNNSLFPASYPMLLNKNGKSQLLVPDTNNLQKIKISQLAIPRPDDVQYLNAFKGAWIEGSNSENFANSKTLLKINNPLKPGTHNLLINSTNDYRYYRICFPSKKIKLNEIEFHSKLNSSKKPQNTFVIPNKLDSAKYISIGDKKQSTGSIFEITSDLLKNKGSINIAVDFGKRTSIEKIELYYSLASTFNSDVEYELLYWDFGWKSLGKTKPNNNQELIFNNVPINALFMIKHQKTGIVNRVFTFVKGKQNWY